MTNQKGAPEAPPPAFVHYPPKKPELARVDFLPIATKAERSNGWVTVALVEAQQPAPSAAACVICGSDEPFTGTCGSGDPRALCKQPSPTPQADSQPAPVQDEREAFETWYCDQMRAAGYNADDGIANLREGNHYGEHRVMLNGKWEGWQARAARKQGANHD